AWVDANAGENGYYRTLYKGDLLKKLLAGAKGLSVAEKVGVIGDVSALTRGGQMQMGDALKLVPELAKDSSREVVTKSTMLSGGRLSENIVPEDLQTQNERSL